MTSSLPQNVNVIALVTIVGLLVLIGLGKIDAAAGLGLIGGLAGLHGGATVASNAATNATQAVLSPSPEQAVASTNPPGVYVPPWQTRPTAPQTPNSEATAGSETGV